MILMFIFIFINLSIASQLQSTSTNCTCSQLYVQFDCNQNSDCQWDSTKMSCIIKESTIPSKEDNQILYYCDQFTKQKSCSANNSCSWINQKCIAFTDCTVFSKSSTEECQGISVRCISDGLNCIEINNCTNYLTLPACLNLSDLQVCYWDSSATSTNQCSIATKCEQLPTSFTTDDQCRNGLNSKQCTVASNGSGCIISGTNCVDQGSEIQCKWNYAYSQECFWNGSSCVDKICTNAPFYTTETLCIKFGGNNCTTNGSGCVIRGNCNDAKVKEACTTNNQNGLCYWNSTSKNCLDLNCGNLDQTFTSNEQCQSDNRLQNCITNGNGCVIDLTCDSAKIIQACESNRKSGLTCYWNGTACVNKICQNASTVTYNLSNCDTYLSTCTGYSNKDGCQDKTCDNAPIGTDCSNWIKTQNCIAKKEGGCIINTTCEVIDLDTSCLVDNSNNKCYWNSINQKCYQWSCSNITITDCPNQDGKCIVNNGQCVEHTCNNSLTNDDCTIDKDGNTCKYNAVCYQKQCNYVITNTQEGCQNYLPNCILNKDSNGCIEIPSQCNLIENKNACIKRQDGNKCVWQSNGNGSCVDLQCNLVQTQVINYYNTIQKCNDLLSGCVPSKDGSSCQIFAITCEGRDNKIACLAEDALTKCAWNSNASGSCYTKSCQQMTNDSTYNKSTITLSSDCTNYKPDPSNLEIQCVVGTATSPLSCVYVSTNCSDFGQLSCIDSTFVKLNCYWNKNQSKCLSNLVCSNLYETSSLNCYQQSNGNCTHKTNDNTAQECVDISATCDYSNAKICDKGLTKSKIKCAYSNGSCQNASCAALQNSTETTDSQCYALSPICTIATTNCQLKGSICASFYFEDQCLQYVLGSKQQCVWNGVTCSDALFTCKNVIGTGLTKGYCQSLRISCSINLDGTACTLGKSTCSDYTGVASSCVWSINGGYCYNKNGECSKATKCYHIPLTNAKACASQMAGCTWQMGDATCSYDCSGLPSSEANYTSCMNYNTECQIKRDGSGCFGITTTCANIPLADIDLKCTVGIDGKCKYRKGDPSTCVVYDSSNQETSSTCSQVVLEGDAQWITDSYCHNSTSNTPCQAKVDGKGCLPTNAGSCAEQNTDNCEGSKSFRCTYNQNTDECEILTKCPDIAYKGYQQMTNQLCRVNGFLNCIVNPNDNTKCADSQFTVSTLTILSGTTCSDYQGKQLTYYNCVDFKNGCSVNFDGTACVDIKDTCNEYSANIINCGYSKNEGVCIISGQQCIQKNCSDAPIAIKTATQCQNYNSNCTASAKCINRTNSCNNLPEQQCYFTFSLSKCYWDSSALPPVCLDASSCTNAPQTTNFTTYSQCQTFSSNCTSKIAISPTNGCDQLQTTCNLYLNLNACQFTLNGANCYWDYVTQTCGDTQSCQTADANYNTHTLCQSYSSIQSLLGTCTVNIMQDGQNLVYKSCISLKQCEQYNYQDQCQLSSQKDSNGNYIICEFNTTTKQCYNKGCNSANDSYTTAAQCYNDYNGQCTIQSDGTGCINIPNNCNDMNQKQCKDLNFIPIDATGNKCIWSTQQNLCVIRTCDIAKDLIQSVTQSNCQNFLTICTGENEPSCKIDRCENYSHDNDDQCKQLLNNSNKCTTNGINCIQRTTCEQNTVQAGCTFDINNKLCQWISATLSSSAHCVLKSCTTAPSDQYTTEIECNTYWPITIGAICTTKSGGGCVIKGNCNSITTNDACNIDSSGISCIWDSTNNLIPCRPKNCSDVSSTTFAFCQLNVFNGSKCILDVGNKCKTNDKCSTIALAAGCIEGSDGPCYWIEDETQNNGGTCYLYDSCKSIASSSFSYCQLVSKNCTTNGINCIGLTQCKDTDNNGCFLGIDGQCVLTSTSLVSNDISCKVFTQCSEVFYITHSECFNSTSNKCTTNGISGCIDLGSCASYTQAGCFLNNIGQITDSKTGLITSTGYCEYDINTNQCRDQICSDFTGISNPETCNQKLNTCTSNGINCITQLQCQDYMNQSSCEIGNGLDGLCIWISNTSDSTKSLCRIKTCSDITDLTICVNIKIKGLCVSDGTNCIAKNTCSNYSTQSACNSGGIDGQGICIWTPSVSKTQQGSCSLMISCSQANNDEIACQAANYACQWSSTLPTNCKDHDCASYQKTINKCTFYQTFDRMYYNICQINSLNVCSAVDPNVLSINNCYIQSAYKYSWTTNGICQSCIANIDNEVNNTNSTNSTNSNFQMEIIIVVIGYLII